MDNEIKIRKFTKEVAGRFENDPAGLLIFLENLTGTSGAVNYYAISGWAYYLSSLGYSELGLFLNKKALENFISKHDAKGEGGCYIVMGNLYRNRGDLQKSKEYFLKSIDIFKKIKSIQDELIGYVNLGTILSDLNEFDYGIKSQEQILERIELIKDQKEKQYILGPCYGNLANLYRDKGELQKSIEHQQRSLEIAKELNNSVEEAANYLEMGETYRLIGKHYLALENYNKSLEIARNLGDKHKIASCLSNIGIIYRLLKNSEKSIEYHLEALKIRKDIEDKFGIGKCYANLGNVFGDIGNLEKAIKCLESSLQYFEDRNCISELAQAYLSLGATYADFDDPDKAIIFYEKALVYAKKVGNRISEMLIYHNLSNNYFKKSNYKDAFEFAKKSLYFEGLIREGLIREELSLTFLKSRFGTYHLAISSVIRLFETERDPKYLKDCLEIIERTKAREIIKKMNIAKKEDIAISEDYKNLDELDSRLDLLEAKIKKNPFIIDVQELDRLYSEKAKLLEVIYRKSLDTSSLIPNMNLSIVDLFWNSVKSYKKNILIIEMYLHEGSIFFFLFDNNKYKLFIQNLSDDAIELAKDFISLKPNNSEDFYKALEQLRTKILPTDLIKELKDLELKDLIIIPHKWLHHIAWEAIMIDGMPLGLKFNLARHYSLDLMRTSLNLKIEGNNSLIISNPNSDLDGAEKECKIVYAQLNEYEKIFLTKENATLSAVKASLPEISIAHFSCHANFDTKDPLMSKLLLEDKSLIANDIILLNLKNHPFVFLNACETGRTGGRTKEMLEYVGDEQLGFVRAFSLAHASTIVVTNWKIRDDIAEYFAKEFYSHNKTKSLVESLREARESTYIGYKDNSCDWASYALYGNPFNRI
jgi:tetratricopeptide (TPR) repeat protein/CHAT domain-containing protein